MTFHRLDGSPSVPGQAKYTADINTPGTLYANSDCDLPLPRGEKSRKCRSSRQLRRCSKGVKAVHLFKKEEDEVRWEGELIVAIAAERVEHAEDAVNAVVVEYEALAFLRR